VSLAQIATKARRQIISFVLTESCNLACTYCYEHQDDKKLFNEDLAKQIITDSFQDPDFDELEIDFFGGEPFIGYKVMRQVCEFVWQGDWPKPFICFATTNGTLVHGPIKEWADANKDRLILGLSLDGTPEMHNRNRSGSFDAIDLDFFRESWPTQPVKMTLSRETLPNLAEGIIYLQQQRFRVTCNPAHGVAWQDEDFTIFSKQLRQLADFYLDNPSVEVCNIIDMPLQAIRLTDRTKNYCGAGKSMHSYDRSGKKYPCPTFMPMTTSQRGASMDQVAIDLRGERNTDNSGCGQCALLKVCPTCYGMNYVRTGNPFLREEAHCRFSKMRAQGTAYLLSRMIANQGRGYKRLQGLDRTEMYHLLQGISIVASGALHH
jgi:radical SAM protein with 4Fe4S-binding SPASM domain